MGPSPRQSSSAIAELARTQEVYVQATILMLHATNTANRNIVAKVRAFSREANLIPALRFHPGQDEAFAEHQHLRPLSGGDYVDEDFGIA